jgi:acyl-coenzyme A synthetase/AMP-(fatty) acid ligase
VKTPKQVEVWADLPRSRVGKVLKSEVRSRLLGQAQKDGLAGAQGGGLG